MLWLFTGLTARIAFARNIGAGVGGHYNYKAGMNAQIDLCTFTFAVPEDMSCEVFAQKYSLSAASFIASNPLGDCAVTLLAGQIVCTPIDLNPPDGYGGDSQGGNSSAAAAKNVSATTTYWASASQIANATALSKINETTISASSSISSTSAAPATIAPTDPPATKPPQPNGNGNLNGDEIQQILDAHNSFRAMLGSGPLAYDEGLASWALGQATWIVNSYGCNLKHGNIGPGQGQNLAQVAGSDPNYSSPMAGFVGGWTSEPLQNYNHATQVAWRHTTTVGCGKVFGLNSNPNFPYCEVLACNYFPSGNIEGHNYYDDY